MKEPNDSRHDVQIERVRNPRRIVLFISSMAVLLAAAFLAGLVIKSPTDDALKVAETSIPVTAAVEERLVSSGFAIPASLAPGTFYDIFVTEASAQSAPSTPVAPADSPASAAADSAPSSAAAAAAAAAEPAPARVIVTSTPIASGSQLSMGQLLGEVSGRPLFSVPVTVPLYRDLIVGSSGKDVAALQQLLVDLDYVGVRQREIWTGAPWMLSNACTGDQVTTCLS